MGSGYKKEAKQADNSTVYNKYMRRQLNCDRCKPHQNENKSSHKKYGTQKPKSRIKRGK